MGYVENDKDAQIVSELMDDIRDAVTDYQVSCQPDGVYLSSHSEKTGPDREPIGHV